MSNQLLEAALSYAARGWPVLPLHSWVGKCTCGDAQCSSPAKHPRTAHGLRDATLDLQTIREWWAKWPDSNVGVRCDRLYVLDIDGPGGAIALQEHGLDPDLHDCTSQTGVGRHLLFQGLPGGRPRSKVLPDVDVRAGEGSYIVAPPSVHWTGAVYEWKADGHPPLLPATIRPVLGLGEGEGTSAPVRDPGPSAGGGGEAPNGRYDNVAQAVAAARERGLLGVGEGQRHDTLLRLVGRQLATGLFTLPELVAYALGWAARCSPAMPEAEALRVVQDLWRAHAAQHGGDPTFDYGEPASRAPKPGVLAEQWGRIDVGTLLRSTPSPQRWLLRHATKDDKPCPPGQGDGMLERGCTGVLSAAGGSGKSMLLLQLAVSIVTGKPWVGFEGPSWKERGRVCYLAGEDTAQSVHRRLLAVVDGMGLSTEEQQQLADQLRVVSLARVPLRLFETDGGGRLLPGRAYEELLQLLGGDGDGKWAALMLDPAARLCGASMELDNDQATACVQHLEKLSSECGDATVLLATHVSKATKLAGQSHARGVSGLGDASRWALGLVADRLECHKANDARPWPGPVYLRRQGRLFVRGDGPIEPENLGDIAAVLEAARALGVQSSRDVLWEAAGLTQTRGRTAVRQAIRRGELSVRTRPLGPGRGAHPIVHAADGCHYAECAECRRLREDKGSPGPAGDP